MVCDLMTNQGCFDSILQHISDGVLIVDHRGVVCFANPAATKLFAQPLPELLGYQFPEPIVGSETRELEIVRPNGELIISQMSVSPTQWQNQPAYVICLRDVTQDKLAEEKIKDTYNLLHLITDNIPAMIAYIDHEQRYRFVNKLYADLLGKSTEQILGEKVENFLGETYKVDLSKVEQALKGERVSFELPVCFTGQKIKHIQVKYTPHIEQGNVLGIFALLLDITKQKETEKALRNSEERYRRLYENTPAILYSIDRDANLISVSNKWLETFGYERSEVIGHKCLDFITEQCRYYAENFGLPAFFKVGFCENLPYQFVKKNGEIVEMLLSATAEKDSEGNFVRSLAVLVDVTAQKKAEKKVQEYREHLEELVQKRTQELEYSQARLAGILDSASDAIISINENQIITLFNKGAERIFGYSASEVIGQSLDCLFPENLLERHRSHLQNFEKSGITSRKMGEFGEIWVQRKDGTKFPAEASISQLVLSEQRIMTAIIRDVSERKEAEKTIKQAHEKYEAILKTTMDGFWLVDEGENKGRILEVNDAYCRMIGYSREELLQMSIAEVEALKDIQTIAQHRKKIIGTGGDRFETCHRRRDGTLIELDVTVNYLPSQGCSFSFLRDITERKQAESLLKSSQQSLLKAQEIAHLGNWDWQITKNYLEWSDEIYRIFGAHPQEFQGTYEAFLEYVHPEDRQMVIQAVNQALENHQTYNVDHRIVRKDGTIRIVNEQADVTFDNKGNPVRMIGTVQDITERKQIEIALKESQKRLQYRLKLERSIAQVSRKLISDQEVDLNSCLAILGETVEASRVYLTRFWEKGTKADMVNEWTSVGVSSSLAHFQNMDMSQFPWWMGTMYQRKNLVIKNVETMPEIAQSEKQVLKAAGVNSLLCVPIFDHLGELWGIIGVDASGENHKKWSEEDGKMLQVVGDMIYNYLSRQTAQVALRESEARFRAIFEQAALGIVLANPSGEFLEVNQKMCDLLGYSAEELLHLTWKDITHADEPEAARTDVDGQLPGHFPFYSQEKLYIRRDGQTQWGNLTLSQILNDKGQPIYRLAMIEDIQGRKQAQRQIEKAKEAAEAANRAKSQFLANISHELRTPLNAILGFTQLMTRSALTPTPHKEYLEIINRSGEHLLGLINDILDLSKIESGKIELQCEDFDLYHLLESIRELLSLKAQGKGLSLIVNIGENVPQFIRTDQKKLRSVLINLLGNGIKFTSEGTITLRVHCVCHSRQRELVGLGQTKCSNKTENTCVTLRFEVEDTGEGIAPSELNTLFDAFVQSQAGQKSAEGTGLGLAISQHFVNLMGGQIKVKSTLGIGSTFSFEIPCHWGYVPHSPSFRSNQRIIGLEPNQPEYRILVVEDQDSNRKLLVNLLESLGFAVKEAVNGKVGLALRQEWQPHLILMDLRMPVMNGYETIEAIREQEKHHKPQTAPCPVVIFALTASVFRNQGHHVLATGCDDFIPKPVEEWELLTKIGQHLGVSYCYENIPISTPKLSKIAPLAPSLSREDLAFMPSEWRAQIYLAAVSARAKRIEKLIAAIPQERNDIIQALTYLLKQLNFERIAELTHYFQDFQEG